MIKSMAFLLFFLIISVSKDSHIPSNEDIIIEHIGSLIDQLPLLNDTSYKIVSDWPARVNAKIFTIFINKGHRLSLEGENEIRLYVESSNSLIHHDRKHNKRLIDGILTVVIVDRDAHISYSGNFEFYEEDILSKKTELSLLISDWKPTDIVKASRTPLIKKYIEPVVLSSAIVTSIYLLYNIRTQ